eukprot:1033863-Amphidinium_carterae.2
MWHQQEVKNGFQICGPPAWFEDDDYLAGCLVGTTDFITMHLQRCEASLTKKRVALSALPLALGAHSNGVQLGTVLAWMLIPSSVVHLLRSVPPELASLWGGLTQSGKSPHAGAVMASSHD